MKMKKIIVFAVTLSLLLSAMLVAIGGEKTDMNQGIDKENEISTSLSLDGDYEEREPIEISNNTDFAEQADENDWLGDGTEDDPYIVEGYKIDGGEDEAILIEDVDVHFKIRENLIEGDHDGLRLRNTENGIIEKNYVRDISGYYTSSGIMIHGSEGIIIQNNIITNSRYHGIGLSGCLNVTIRNNSLEGNRGGITLLTSNKNTIKNNTVYNGSTGLKFHMANHNTAVRNYFLNNEHHGIDVYASVENDVIQNIIYNNEYGFNIAVEPGSTASRDNMIYGNDFIENDQQAVNRGDNYYHDETESMGNYWSDYEEKYPDAEKDNGVWDTPYEDDEEDGFVDEYPLVDPGVPYISIEYPEDGAVIEYKELTIDWMGRYRYEEELEYEVRLDDGEWEQVGEETEYDIEFSQSGSHTFEVRAANVDIPSVGGTVDFTVDIEVDIQVENFLVEPLEGSKPLEVDIFAELENVGEVEGSISLYIGDEEFRTWTLDVGENVLVNESYEFDEAGAYTIKLGAEREIVKVMGLYELTVEVEGEGDVNIEPEKEEYVQDMEVNLSAVAEEGWAFVGWTGDYEGEEDEIKITMDEDKEITAVFEEQDDGIPGFTLTLLLLSVVISVKIYKK